MEEAPPKPGPATCDSVIRRLTQGQDPGSRPRVVLGKAARPTFRRYVPPDEETCCLSPPLVRSGREICDSVRRRIGESRGQEQFWLMKPGCRAVAAGPCCSLYVNPGSQQLLVESTASRKA